MLTLVPVTKPVYLELREAGMRSQTPRFFKFFPAAEAVFSPRNIHDVAKRLLATQVAERFRAAMPIITREMPVIRRFTPTRVPMAQTELEGQ